MAVEDAGMSPKTAKERFDKWYSEKGGDYNAKRRARYRNDPEYRQAVLERSRKRREAARKRKARARFRRDMDKRDLSEARRWQRSVRAGRRGMPRRIPPVDEVLGPGDDRTGQWVYGTTALSSAVGRSQSTVRAWLSEGVLPGASTIIGQRYWFTRPFIDAVLAACRKVYEHDSNGSRAVLKGLVKDALVEAGVSWVPPGGKEKDRRKS